MEFRKIGVLGAGNIGIGVVTDLVLHGLSVVVVDLSEDVLKRAEAEVLKNVRFAPLLSKTLPRITKNEALQRMVLTTDLPRPHLGTTNDDDRLWFECYWAA